METQGTPEGSRARLLFRGSLCYCSPHSRAPTSSGCPGGLPKPAGTLQSRQAGPSPEINVNRESDHTPQGTRESHQCPASFFLQK